MNNIRILYFVITLPLLLSLIHCGQVNEKDTDYLLSFIDTLSKEVGYKKPSSEIIIAAGKYPFCFTDTFRHFAIVAQAQEGLVAIDRQENILYHVFPFDNGPDYPSEGFFRIEMNNKIGFADAQTGKIVIAPQYDGAYSFQKGFAKVSIGCQTITDGEHRAWTGGTWFYIDKSGKKVDKPINNSK